MAGDHLYGKMAVHLAVAGDVFDGVLFCAATMNWFLNPRSD